MAERDAQYDPYIPAGGAAPAAGGAQQNPGNQRTAALQAVSCTLFYLHLPSYQDTPSVGDAIRRPDSPGHSSEGDFEITREPVPEATTIAE